MQPKPLASVSDSIKLLVEIVSEAAKAYLRRWRLLLSTMALGWLPLCALELWLMYWLGAPILIRIEPFLSRLSSTEPFDLAQVGADLDLSAALSFLLLSGVIIIGEYVVFRNIVTGALIRAAAGQATRALPAYRLSPLRYLSLMGVTLITAVMICLPSLLLALLWFGMLLLAPSPISGLWYVLEVLLPLAVAAAFISAGFFFILWFALAPQSVVIEGRSALAAVRRSGRLLRGRYPMVCVFGVMALLGGPRMIVDMLISPLVHTIGGLIFGDAGFGALGQVLISQVASQVSAGLLMPFDVMALTLLYQRLAALVPDSRSSVAQVRAAQV